MAKSALKMEKVGGKVEEFALTNYVLIEHS